MINERKTRPYLILIGRGVAMHCDCFSMRVSFIRSFFLSLFLSFFLSFFLFFLSFFSFFQTDSWPTGCLKESSTHEEVSFRVAGFSAASNTLAVFCQLQYSRELISMVTKSTTTTTTATTTLTTMNDSYDDNDKDDDDNYNNERRRWRRWRLWPEQLGGIISTHITFLRVDHVQTRWPRPYEVTS